MTQIGYQCKVCQEVCLNLPDMLKHKKKIHQNTSEFSAMRL